MNTGEVLEHDSFEYSGPVELCKGDQTAKASEIAQAQFQQQLMGIFQQQYGKQSEVLDFLKGKLQPMIDHPTGYSDSAKAAMRAQAVDNISQQYDNAQKAIQGMQFVRGGRDLPSGVDAMQIGGLKVAQAQDTAGALNTITLNDENLKESNYWNAMNVLSGNVASQFNPLGYAGATNSAADATANLSQAFTASNQSQLLGALGGIAGGVGAALGCPVDGSLILMADSTWKLAEEIRKGDLIMGADREADEVADDPAPSLQFCVNVVTASHAAPVSVSHTFMRAAGGYAFAETCKSDTLWTTSGSESVQEVKPLPEQMTVRYITTKRSHGYCVNGLWSLE